MAKNSVEKKIREVLQERTISPSESAWNKIEAELGPASTAPGTKYWRYGIAAGFIGVLFISIFFFTQRDNKVLPSQEVVRTNVTDPEVLDNKIQGSTDLGPEDTEVLVQKNVEAINQTKEEIPAETNKMLAQKARNPEIRNERVVEDYVSLDKVDTKIAEVMTQVTIMEQQKGAVSDATIDSLLRAAQKELISEQILGESQAVDALALLTDVEDELNLSLRDQLFEKLKDGYQKVRSAIAYRNE
jgi:hypothetical protein